MLVLVITSPLYQVNEKFTKALLSNAVSLISVFDFIFTAENLKFQNSGTKESIVIIPPTHAPQEVICLMTKLVKFG